jgi:hypothetical protein
MYDFCLQNLDGLHDHLGTLYPGMRSPSFRCTERPEDGALVLHYYSDRPGLEHIVIGIVKVIHFGTNVTHTYIDDRLAQWSEYSPIAQEVASLIPSQYKHLCACTCLFVLDLDVIYV